MKQNKSFIIGLTGTMGSGKSECSRILSEKFNLPIIDADQITAKICKKGGKGLEIIKEYFGPEYILENGEYNRRLMSQTINSDYSAFIKLNTILHPIIKEEKEKELETLSDAPIVIYDCPLLFETGEDTSVDDILLITVDDSVRLERIKARDNLTEDEIKKRISLQLPEEEKIKKSDTVIFNNTTLEELESSLENYIKKLI